MLSSKLWSPSDDFSPDFTLNSQRSGIEQTHSNDSRQENFSSSFRVKSYRENKGNWVRPYNQNDIPEWTDNVGLNVDPESIFLPNSRWIWVNDWTVDRSGVLDVTVDSDGWEYSVDFESFTRCRRSYR